MACKKSHQKVSTLRERLASYELTILVEALGRHGTYREAARELGIGRSTLARKLAAMGLTHKRTKLEEHR